MNKIDVVLALTNVRESKNRWARGITEFNSGVDAVMGRLLHEAAAKFMSAEDVAHTSGFTVKRIRQMMRDVGLNPRDGKTMLSQKAAEALATNAALMGIEPHEMDLTSPLAYLPMGDQMKRELAALSEVKPDEFPETEHTCSTLAIIEDEAGVRWFQCPECKHAVKVQDLQAAIRTTDL